ncbi:MAG: XdhC/CoxI family protein [Caldiserica bacterium]|nr:XdhC/CoxI family protein [Caldisericota bacterium]MDH7562440.1 XdhC/CoxI family protein [Caldisericota bacterium]
MKPVSQKDIFEEIVRLRNSGEEGALAIVVNTSSSSPGRVNFKMLVYPDGQILGTVGGGVMEKQVMEEALKCISDKRSRFLHFSLREDEMEGLGVLCGGEADVYIEPVGAPPFLYIFGGGHVGFALYQVASLLEFRIIIVDDRPAFASPERFPRAHRIIQKDFEEALREINFYPSDFAVIVTRGHAHDQLVLREILKKERIPGYIGMIGSRAKNARVFQNLEKEGIPRELLTRVFAPIGLDIGGEKPEEIAISILAEIIAFRHGKIQGKTRDNSTAI